MHCANDFFLITDMSRKNEIEDRTVACKKVQTTKNIMSLCTGHVEYACMDIEHAQIQNLFIFDSGKSISRPNLNSTSTIHIYIYILWTQMISRKLNSVQWTRIPVFCSCLFSSTSSFQFWLLSNNHFAQKCYNVLFRLDMFVCERKTTWRRQ